WLRDERTRRLERYRLRSQSQKVSLRSQKGERAVSKRRRSKRAGSQTLLLSRSLSQSPGVLPGHRRSTAQSRREDRTRLARVRGLLGKRRCQWRQAAFLLCRAARPRPRRGLTSTLSG